MGADTSTTRLRWGILALLFAISAVPYMDRVNFSVTARQMMPAFGLTGQDMGYVFSAFVFGYALCQIPGGRLQNAAGKIVASLSEPFQVAGRSLTISCSVGIARFPDDGDTADSLVQHADHAMYRAKKQGRASWSL